MTYRLIEMKFNGDIIETEELKQCPVCFKMFKIKKISNRTYPTILVSDKCPSCIYQN